MKKTTTIAIILMAAIILASCGGQPRQNNSLVKVDISKTDLENGKAVYAKTCFSCHKDGMAGAAKIDDKKRWAESASKGLENLQKTVINGVASGAGTYGIMPPRGLCHRCSDKDILDAIGYMLYQAGVGAE